ncbi:hypothetical protein [Asaia krungthepensis]|uniref:Auto-transporter adhesin head GIN domain-containing protein n=1 Tax=Asaia krungthepensis NRIC 0535 TaxID=1307925 RepID=A0ABQ0Q0L3_9PROT|nr:hypothetical protein [Asaia krungthepensis]GBQ86208.1 hypothetical protein AA0535_0961 [Asaia krungthepensis NRIC 0535]
MMSDRLLGRPMHRPVHRPLRRVALAALLLCGLAGAPSLHAAPQVVDAEDLDLSVPCLGRFEIMVDPAMSDGVSIDSAPSNGAHLTMRTGKTQGSSKVLITSKACAPNARVSILVAPNVGVMIHDSHDTHIVIHGTLASLEASLEAGQLDADTIQSLDLSLRGTEQVHIAHLNRAAQVVETGASGLVVDQADLDAFSAQLSETSHLSVTDGRFDVLTLMVENAASVRLGGSVNTATVSATGTGLVAIPTVSGALTRTGNVQIGPGASAQAVSAPPTPPPAAVASPPPPPAPSISAPPGGQSAPAMPSSPAIPSASGIPGQTPGTPLGNGQTQGVPDQDISPQGNSTQGIPAQAVPAQGVPAQNIPGRANAGTSPSAPGTDGSGIPRDGLNVQNLPTQTAPVESAPVRTNSAPPAPPVPVPASRSSASPPAPPQSQPLPTDRSVGRPVTPSASPSAQSGNGAVQAGTQTTPASTTSPAGSSTAPGGTAASDGANGIGPQGDHNP